MRGGDGSRIRAYNERLIVSAIMREGSLSKADLARTTGLSANAAMVIANSLIDQGLLVKREPVRGRVGQPHTPIAVNPVGAYAIGVKIGRRSVQSVLVDLRGEVVSLLEERHAYPDPARTIDAASRQCRDLLATVDAPHRERVVGLGIAMPGQLDAWAAELGLAPGTLDGWRDADVAGELQCATGLDASLYNDGSAACAAEMIVGDAIAHRTALYIYFGTFIGGGVVIDGRLYRGERQNAGSIGSMPSAGNSGGSGREQLIHRASLLQLETRLEEAGVDSVRAIAGEGGAEADTVFARWQDVAAPAVAEAIVSALSVIDFQTIAIDGRLAPRWRRDLKQRIVVELQARNLSGLFPPEIATGSIGAMAPVLGAAMLPLHARFSPSPDILVRSG